MRLLEKYVPYYEATPEPAPEPAPPPVEQVLAADPPAPEPTPEPTPEPAGDKEHGNKGKTPWYMREISDLRHAKQTLAERAEEAERRAQNAAEMLRRLQPDGGANNGNAPPAPARDDRAPDFDAAVRAEAARLEAQKTISSVANSGAGKFQDWGEKANILGAVGAATPEFVLDAATVAGEKAHELLYQLAADPERAAQLGRMDRIQRVAELAKMSAASAAPKVTEPPKTQEPPKKEVSKAPPPPPAVEPSASKDTPWYADDVSDAEFSRKFDENLAKRARRR